MSTSEKGSKLTTELQPVICIMAHNEESNVAKTIMSILQGNRDVNPKVKVYANGCTDSTHKIVRELSVQNPAVELVEITEASKANAWNIAFEENNNEILIYSDADVLPEPGAVGEILEAFERQLDLEIACCESVPYCKGLNWQQKTAGFMLIPLNQDFLLGNFYGVRCSAFRSHFRRLGISGLPSGIVGDDAFLDSLVDRRNFFLVDKKSWFQPPNFLDYCKILARLKWQSDQIVLFYSTQFLCPVSSIEPIFLRRVINKVASSKSIVRFLLGSFSALSRLIFMLFMKGNIDNEHRKLGPVSTDGSWVLSNATRSTSVK